MGQYLCVAMLDAIAAIYLPSCIYAIPCSLLCLASQWHGMERHDQALLDSPSEGEGGLTASVAVARPLFVELDCHRNWAFTAAPL